MACQSPRKALAQDSLHFLHLLMVLALLTGVLLTGAAADLSLTATPSKSGVTLRWKGSGAYQVCLREDAGRWTKLGESGAGHYFVSANTLTSGRQYRFGVLPAQAKATDSALTQNSVAMRYIKTPVLLSAAGCSTSAVKLSWEPSPGAVNYRVRYKTGSGKWTLAGDTTGTSLKVKGLRANTRYCFTVLAVSADGKQAMSAYDADGVIGWTWTKPLEIDGVAVDGQYNLCLTWQGVRRSASYAVLCRKAGTDKWNRAGTTTGTVFTVSGLQRNGVYELAVRGMDANGAYLSGIQSKQVRLSLKNAQYVVSCNGNYSDKVSVLGRYTTQKEALAAIRKQSADTRGQWYVYDAMDHMKVVYPTLNTKTQRLKKAVEWAEAVAEDSRHGYSCVGEQSNRNVDVSLGRWGRYGDYSCSTLVVTAYELAGLADLRQVALDHHLTCTALGKRYSNGLNASNLAEACLKSGKFKDVTDSFRKSGISALQPGDILINRSNRHAAMYIGGGRMVEAVMNELGREYATPTPGDQTGKEIHTRSCKSNWGTVLRLK